MDYPIITIDQNRAVAEARARRDIVLKLRADEILRDGVDYGAVPGTTKPTLLKPGAERLCAALGLDPRFELQNCIENFDAAAPLFHYRYMCRLIHIETGAELATGIGSCNSMESKYRWRKAGVCPNCGKATIKRSKYAPKGQPNAEPGWYCYAKVGGCGAEFAAKDPAIIEQPEGNVPNDDVFSLVNTIDKMAQKRALIAATLIGANASEFFTQDVEDLPGFGGLVVEGEFSEVKRDEPLVEATERKPATNGKKPPIPFESIKPDLPVASGTQWTSDEAAAWAKRNRDDFNVNALKAALGIKERWGEWTGDADSASKRLTAWMDAQGK